jgi:methionyl-tRNA formyltransferase
MACDQRFAHRRRKSAPGDVTADSPIVARPSLIQHVAENNPGKARMKLTLVGSRFFGAAALERLLKEGVEIARVIVSAADDRLGVAATAAGLDVVVLDDPSIVPAEAIADGTDLIVAAHSHARVSSDALARSRLGGIGFHPSLLPRHRGIAAVEWTIREGDPIAGGSIYHLAEQMDAGAIAAQDWCFVRKGETARDLWERALAPMGLDLLLRVIREARINGKLPATPQDEQFATRAPMHRK